MHGKMQRSSFLTSRSIWVKRLGYALIVLTASISASGCSSRGFERFMDHPILSWAPFTQADVDSLNPLPSTEQHINLYPIRECYLLAQERTEELDLSEYYDRTIRDIFNKTYKDCVIARSRWGT
jgi:hypothetical protein